MVNDTEVSLLMIVLLWMVSFLLGQSPVSLWRLVTKNERTSRSLTAGRLETFHDGRWGTVCSDGFDSDDAAVLCQILTGSSQVLIYGTVESERLSFDQGSSSTPIWIANLNCSQLTCSHNGYGNTHNCSHSKDVAISCLAEGAVRLSYRIELYSTSSGAPVGLLEVYHSGQWGTVCDNGFDQMDADVVCRQLGYNRAYKYGNVTDIGYNYGFSRYRSNNRIIWLSDLHCTSADITLVNCSHSGFSPSFWASPPGCNHSKDVAIECISMLSLRLVTKREKTASYLLAGRVEVLHNGQWGTICSKGFDLVDAEVLCQRITGFSRVLRYGEVGSYGLQFDGGPSTTPVLLENLRCRKAGYVCYHDGFGNTDCSHDQDIAISCLARGAIRLQNITSFNAHTSAGGPAGRLEIYIQEYIYFYDVLPSDIEYRWIPICVPDGIDQTAADIACRQLGYEKAYNYGGVVSLGYRVGSDYITRNFQCSSDDLLLTNCSSGPYSPCPGRDDDRVAVSCIKTGLSGAQISGIVFGILTVLCCTVCLVTGLICHRKGACTSSTTSCILSGTNRAPQNHFHLHNNRHTSGSIYVSQVHYPSSPRQQTDNTTTGEPSAPPLEAVTHSGEAPPAYSTAVCYKTVTLDTEDVGLSRSLALAEHPISTTDSDAPPAYNEACDSKETVNE